MKEQIGHPCPPNPCQQLYLDSSYERADQPSVSTQSMSADSAPFSTRHPGFDLFLELAESHTEMWAHAPSLWMPKSRFGLRTLTNPGFKVHTHVKPVILKVSEFHRD
jgi:hypothetical protein